MRLSLLLSTLVLAAASVFAATEAHAEGAGFAVDNPSISERGSDWFAVDSVAIQGPLLPSVGVVGDWAHRPLVARNADGSERAALVADVWTAHLGASMVFAERIRASFSLPLQLHADGDSFHVNGAALDAPSGGASLGDLRMAVDARVYGVAGGPVRIAVGAAMWLPTGSAAAYSTDIYVRAQPRVTVAGDRHRFAYAASTGIGIGRAGEPGNEHVGAELTFAASGGLRFLDRRLLVGPEIFGSTGSNGRGAPVEALLGAHYTTPTGFRIGAGIGAGLTSASGNPDARGLLSFEWIPFARAAAPMAAPYEPAPAPAPSEPVVEAPLAETPAPVAESDAARDEGPTD